MSNVIPFPIGRARRPAPIDHLEASRRALEPVRIALGLPEWVDTGEDHLEASRRALEPVRIALGLPESADGGTR